MTTDSPAASVENPVKTGGSGQGKFREGGRPYSPKSGAYLPDIHRSLPQSLDAEKGLLGSILLAPGRVLDECIQQQVGEKYFHHPAHARIFTVLVDMREASKPIDLISLTQLLEDRHLLEQVGGAAAVTDLFTFVPTASNAAYYLEILREKYLLRAIIGTCTEYGARAYEEQGDVQILLDEAEQRILAIGDDRLRGKVPEMKELAMEALDSIEKLFQNRGALTGLPTGFKGIDVMTNGMHAGEMIVIAARPSMGKTALAMNIAEHVAIEAGKPVAVYSLEMSTQQLMQRLLCSHARVDLKKIRDGFIGKHDMTNLIQATTRLSDAGCLSTIRLDWEFSNYARARDALRTATTSVDRHRLPPASSLAQPAWPGKPPDRSCGNFVRHQVAGEGIERPHSRSRPAQSQSRGSHRR